MKKKQNKGFFHSNIVKGVTKTGNSRVKSWKSTLLKRTRK
jgi:hypothetical protein